MYQLIKQSLQLCLLHLKRGESHRTNYCTVLQCFLQDCVCSYECARGSIAPPPPPPPLRPPPPPSQPFAVRSMCPVIDSWSSVWLLGMPPECVCARVCVFFFFFLRVCSLRACDMPGLMSSGVINRTVTWPGVLPSALLPPLQTLGLVELIASCLTVCPQGFSSTRLWWQNVHFQMFIIQIM